MYLSLTDMTRTALKVIPKFSLWYDPSDNMMVNTLWYKFRNIINFDANNREFIEPLEFYGYVWKYCLND